MNRVIPQLKLLSGFRAHNFEAQLTPLYDKRREEYNKLQKEIDNYLARPTVVHSHINDKTNFSSEYYQTEVSPLYGHKEIVKYRYCDKVPLINGLEQFEKGKQYWSNLPIETRMEKILKVADLIKGKYFYQMLAATMVGQGKNLYQANIDCIQELVDFLYFNVDYSLRMLKEQPISTKYEKNYSQYLPMSGFVASYTPFNFTAIAGNLAISPLIWGNSVFWKPSEKALLSNYLLFQICMEVGIPNSVLNFVVSDYQVFTNMITKNKNLGTVLFTGSTFGFNNVIQSVNDNYINKFIQPGKTRTDTHYNYPRIMGETGGKNFHFVEKTADLDLVVERTYESAFGYSGQKCSACSRLYLPMEMWEPFKHKILQKIKLIFADECGVISHYKYNELTDYINELKNDEMVDVYSPQDCNDEISYFVCPTLVLCHTSNHFIMEKEMFGPILAVRLYTDMEDAIKECKTATPYRLTGSVFSQDDTFLDESINIFAENCGNFYINDKSTGAVVGQQPFGGFGVSGTNDKAGDKSFMRRLCNQRNIKVSNKKKL